MEINLNDKAFSTSKTGDIFIVEEKDGIKYAKPISKKDLLKEELTDFKKIKEEFKQLKQIVNGQNETIKNYSNAIHKFIKIMEGEEN